MGCRYCVSCRQTQRVAISSQGHTYGRLNSHSNWYNISAGSLPGSSMLRQMMRLRLRQMMVRKLLPLRALARFTTINGFLRQLCDLVTLTNLLDGSMFVTGSHILFPAKPIISKRRPSAFSEI